MEAGSAEALTQQSQPIERSKIGEPHCFNDGSVTIKCRALAETPGESEHHSEMHSFTSFSTKRLFEEPLKRPVRNLVGIGRSLIESINTCCLEAPKQLFVSFATSDGCPIPRVVVESK